MTEKSNQTRDQPASTGGFDWRAAEIDMNDGIDNTVPHSARVWNYWLGGKDNYAIDQQAGEDFAAVFPSIGMLARATTYLRSRMLAYLAGPAGIDQFIDVGVGLPAIDPVHEIAQHHRPGAHVVYVDNDALAAVFARALLVGDPAETTTVLDADLADPHTLIRLAGQHLDLTRPYAVLVMNVLRHIPITADDQHARAIVGELRAALPSGGALAVCDMVDDPLLRQAVDRYNAAGAHPWYLRSPAQLTTLFDGLELLDPGVVPISHWRPDPDPHGNPHTLAAWAGLAHQP